MTLNKNEQELHGATVRGKQTPEYMVWSQMVQRCFNKKCRKYKRYGGRGITMDPRWRESFATFLKDVGQRPSRKYQIERIDNNKGYWPDNVKWATRLQQARNKATNRRVLYNGKEYVLSALAKKYRVSKNRIRERLESGWTPEQAVRRKISGCKCFVTYNGVERSLKEWAKVLDMDYQTLYARVVRLKWPPERAFTEPSMRKKKLVAGPRVAQGSLGYEPSRMTPPPAREGSSRPYP